MLKNARFSAKMGRVTFDYNATLKAPGFNRRPAFYWRGSVSRDCSNKLTQSLKYAAIKVHNFGLVILKLKVSS